MPTVTKLIATGTLEPGEMHRVHAEAKSKSATLGAKCSRVRCEVATPNDSIIFDFDVAPIDAEVDALLAAYPSTDTPVASSFTTVSNTVYLLADEPIGIGEVVLYDYSIFCTLGTAAAIQPQSEIGSLLAWRNTTGDVQVNLAPSIQVGIIPSFRLTAAGTTETAQLSVRMGKAGPLVINTFNLDRKAVQVIS